MVDTDRIAGAARELGGMAQGTAENLLGQARDAAWYAADEVSDYAVDTYDPSRGYAWEGHQRSVEWPHTSLNIAGLVGFGLGLLVCKF